MTTKRKKRIQLGVIVSREMKARIAAMARKSGQSQGQIAEQLMLKAFAYEDLVAATRKGIEEIHMGNIDAELFRLGYRRIRRTNTATGEVVTSGWVKPGSFRPLEPGELASQRGEGFLSWKEGERPPFQFKYIEHEDGRAEFIPEDEDGNEILPEDESGKEKKAS